MKRALLLALALCACSSPLDLPEQLCEQRSWHGDETLVEFLEAYGFDIHSWVPEGTQCLDLTVYRSDGTQFIWHIDLRSDR